VVVWHAAAGGVGLIACQWLRALGVTVIGTAGSDRKAEVALQNGCERVFHYGEREALLQTVRELSGGAGVPVVYDSVGKDTLGLSLDCLAPRGLLVSFGNASGKPDPVDLLTLSQKGSLYVTRPTLGHYTATEEELRQSAGALFGALASGSIRPLVAQHFALKQAKEAHEALEARATVGSTILRP
jgi:NADPH2:quinone reductase